MHLTSVQAPTVAAPATPDALNILVGTITSVKKHPEAEKLFLEDIDVGEEAPRQVISGAAPSPQLRYAVKTPSACTLAEPALTLLLRVPA